MWRDRDKPVLALTSETGGFYIGLVKWRNQMLALFCLVVFFAFGVFYFKYWVIQKPFGIILFIGEGLDARQLAAARLLAGGVDKPLAIDSLRHAALLKNYSSDSSTPDVAAAATALATGVKVNNGAIAIDVDGNRLATLLELARHGGRMTGLVTNGRVTSPTAASFSAHTLAPDDRQEIARQLVANAKLDVVLGGGLTDFAAEAEDGQSTDGRDLVADLSSAGYEIVHALEELEEVPRWRKAKLIGLFADAELAFAGEAGAQDDQPTLVDMVRRAIELLQYHRGGYLLVVDAALMRKAADENDAERRTAETVELDRAVSEALRYAGAKSLIFVCADVAVRSAVAGQPVANGSGTPGAKQNSADAAAPPVEAAAEDGQLAEPAQAVTTPAITLQEPTASALPLPNETISPERASSSQARKDNSTAEDVVAFGTGLGANALHGVAESTVIFDIILDNL